MKHKRELPIISTATLIICILLALTLGSTPRAEGYVTMQFNHVPMASYMGDNTRIFSITITTDNAVDYVFSADGETILNVPENEIVTDIGVSVYVNDNYVGSITEARARTRVELFLTDDADATQYADNFTGSPTKVLPLHLGDYWVVIWEYETNVPLTPGNWDLDAEYFVLAIPV